MSDQVPPVRTQKSRVRVQLDISEADLHEADRLIHAFGCATRTELFRRALGVMKLLREIRAAGGRLEAVYPDGERHRIVVL